MTPLQKDLLVNGCKQGVLGSIVGLMMSPGLLAATLYRASAAMYSKGTIGKIISKVLWRCNVIVNGCYLSPKAKIGAGLHLPHPVGVVIGDGAVIGEEVTIYQGVTLGIRGRHGMDYPSVGDGAILYAGAVVAGGVRIGSQAIIGAQALVLADVPSHAIAVGSPARAVSGGDSGAQA